MCVCVFFSAENVGSLETQISQKNTQTQISDEKNKKQKTSIRSRLGRGALNTCKISGSNSQKRRGRWHLKEFGVLCLNQPISPRGARGAFTSIITVFIVPYAFVTRVGSTCPFSGIPGIL